MLKFIKKHKNSNFIIQENGEVIKYKSFLEYNEELKNFKLGKNCLFFLENSFSIEFISVLIFLLNKKNCAILIFDKNVSDENFFNLIKSYKPQYIISFQRKLFKDYEIVNKFKKINFFQSRFKTKYQINPDLKLLLATSGSTGNIKYVRCTLKNILANSLAIKKYLNLNKKSITITTLSFNYVYGLSVLITHFISGGSIILTNKNILEKKFWKIIKKYNCNNLNFVPYSYELLDKINKLKSLLNLNLNFMTSAGDALNKYMIEKISNLNKKKIPFYRMYGQAEATSRIAYVPPKYFSLVDCIGIPVPGGKIFQKGNKKVSELFYKGKNVSLGYSKSYKDLKKKDINKGIIATGDIGYKGKNKLYFLVNRKKRYVKIYGINFNLEDFEKKYFANYNLRIYVIKGIKPNSITIFFQKAINRKKIINFFINNYRIHYTNIKLKIIKKIPLTYSGKISYKELEKYND